MVSIAARKMSMTKLMKMRRRWHWCLASSRTCLYMMLLILCRGSCKICGNIVAEDYEKWCFRIVDTMMFLSSILFEVLHVQAVVALYEFLDNDDMIVLVELTNLWCSRCSPWTPCSWCSGCAWDARSWWWSLFCLNFSVHLMSMFWLNIFILMSDR